MDIQEQFKSLLLKGYSSAENAHKEIFNEVRYEARKHEQIPVVIGYLSIAASYINSAQAVYINNDDLSHSEFDDFFQKFYIFQKEIMTSIKTDHSHQWTDIEFLSFKESYKDVASLFGIVVD